MTAIELYNKVGVEAAAKVNGGSLLVYAGGESFRWSGETWSAYVDLCGALAGKVFRPGACVAGPYRLDVPAEKRACGVFLSVLEKAGVEFTLVRGETRESVRYPKPAVWVWKKDVANPERRSKTAELAAVKTVVKLRTRREVCA
jgi:hypothetical protein